MALPLLKKNGFSGCVVHLDYEKIINSTDIVTGAQLSPFDRCVYDAVVTLYIASNSVFSTADIWHIISHNPKAKITATTRQKIVRSIFHISRFWISIDTDDSNNYFYWCNLRKINDFNSERKIYKNLPIAQAFEKEKEKFASIKQNLKLCKERLDFISDCQPKKGIFTA